MLQFSSSECKTFVKFNSRSVSTFHTPKNMKKTDQVCHPACCCSWIFSFFKPTGSPRLVSLLNLWPIVILLCMWTLISIVLWPKKSFSRSCNPRNVLSGSSWLLRTFWWRATTSALFLQLAGLCTLLLPFLLVCWCDCINFVPTAICCA